MVVGESRTGRGGMLKKGMFRSQRATWQKTSLVTAGVTKRENQGCKVFPAGGWSSHKEVG